MPTCRIPFLDARRVAPAHLAAMFAGLILAPAAPAGWGKAIRLDECPAPVRALVDARIDDGTLDEIRVGTLDDRPLYRIEIERPEYRDLELDVRADGTLVETRSELPWDDAPQAVRTAALAASGAGGQIDDVFRRRIGQSEEFTFIIEIDRVNLPDLHIEFAPSGEEISRRDEVED